VIGAIQGKALRTACLFEGDINSDVFHAWVIFNLLPKVPDGAVIVMDNASFHWRADTQAAIAKSRRYPGMPACVFPRFESH